MKYCRGIKCPNKKQCLRYKEVIDDSMEVINKCLNNKEFIKNG